MSIDKSLKRRSAGSSNRSVLTRAERIKKLQELEKWTDGRSPFGLPKVRVQKIVLKKAKKAEKAAEGAEGASAEGAPGAAPAPAAPAASGTKAAPPKK
ncbi:MAG TPA: small basic protein [Gemmataceae bacterium]|nr:small basic protein [Gemmataceae bacterium]